MMSDKVWLYYSNESFGPGAVVRNLKAGLEEIGVEILRQPGGADFFGCLQNPGRLYDRIPHHALMGPNLFVVPSEAQYLVEKYQNFIVPSDWVKTLYESFPVMRHKTIQTWPVGIDTATWKPSPGPKECDYFVYQKHTPGDIGEEISFTLKDQHGLRSGGWLNYGIYKETDLKELCDRCRFAVLVTDTESQGIAYMQILSSGLPCFVVDKRSWSYNGPGAIQAAASSVPYFDKNTCGITVPSRGQIGMNESDEAELARFVKNVDKSVYSPREYILENHTLAQGATDYMRLIRKAAGL